MKVIQLFRYQGQKLVTEGPILELNNVTRNQAGTYLCQAENKHGVITDKTQETKICSH